MNKPIYLDYAAATPVDPSVIAAMEPYFGKAFYNPSAGYLAAKAVKTDIQGARARIASIVGAKPSEIIFTAGGTEANNLAIQGVVAAFPGAEVLVSALEHDSVLEPAQAGRVTEVAITADGRIDLADFERKLNDNIVLVSVMYANNEIGTIQPIREVAQIAASVRKDRQKRGVSLPLYLHTDAAQAAVYLDLHVHKLGVDLMTINGGKIYGPKQTGILIIKTGTQLKAQILGGGQERSLRSGTENVPGIIGLAAALELVADRKKEETARLQSLQAEFMHQIKLCIPDAVINGSLKYRLPNNIHVTIPGVDNERLMMELDERGVMCATGSACSASSDKPSHVLAALGLSDEMARSSLRFTMGNHTTIRDIKTVVQALDNIVNQS